MVKGALRFTTLWIYTILKLIWPCFHLTFRFTTLWIYTILKQRIHRENRKRVLLPYGFTLFSNDQQAEFC